MENADKFHSKPQSHNVKYKICLISLYSSSAIGPRYLLSVLANNGFDVSMLFFKEKNIALDLMELPSPREYDLLLNLLHDLDPSLVGISVRSSFFNIATTITHRIQRELGVPVMWGGTHATVAPEQSIQVADMVCLGEGEHALLQFASKHSKHRSLRQIDNLWINHNNNIIRNQIGPLIADVDSLPYPDYGNKNKYFIQNHTVSNKDPGLDAFNLDIMTSRGCPYHCTYCSNSLFHELYKGKGHLVRQRSVQNVLDEIKVQQKLFSNLKRIDFIDEVFSWSKEWVEEFASLYKRDIALPFHCMQHPNTTNRDIMKLLKDAGLERVEIGIQTGSERVRTKIFKRPVSDARLIKTSQIMRELDIVPFYDIIVDNPFETPDDKKRGLDLLLRMSRPFYMHMFSMIYFPNTVLTRKALAANLISEDQVEGNATKSFDQMYVSLKHPRPSLDLFWISLYSLTSKSLIPKGLIKVLSRIAFLKTHPYLLVSFANLCNTLKLASIAVKWLFEGKPVLASLGKRSNSLKRGSRVI